MAVGIYLGKSSSPPSNSVIDNDERRALIARRSFISVPQPCHQRQAFVACCSLFLNPAFNNDDERQAFVARRSFIFVPQPCLQLLLLFCSLGCYPPPQQ